MASTIQTGLMRGADYFYDIKCKKNGDQFDLHFLFLFEQESE